MSSPLVPPSSGVPSVVMPSSLKPVTAVAPVAKAPEDEEDVALVELRPGASSPELR